MLSQTTRFLFFFDALIPIRFAFLQTGEWPSLNSTCFNFHYFINKFTSTRFTTRWPRRAPSPRAVRPCGRGAGRESGTPSAATRSRSIVSTADRCTSAPTGRTTTTAGRAGDRGTAPAGGEEDGAGARWISLLWSVSSSRPAGRRTESLMSGGRRGGARQTRPLPWPLPARSPA